ncbi:MAG: efflux RND transporter periplasmic adaptor subunit [Reyranella sp.]|nr:efflux RND transporter periplasmic adaptor subunit [Reyranella sp.]MBL6653693.1 efflux RND transporter periplasmic adaptor subunit [Reyranella sp.]
MKRMMVGTVVAAAVGAAAWIANSQQTANGTTAPPAQSGPLIARGYTDAPAGTVMLANDPNGGSLLMEMRVREGQTVKRDDIIAVMANYPAADVGVQMAENNLRKSEWAREKILKGTRVIDLKLEEDALKSAIEQDKLNTMLRNRAGLPPEEKELQVSLAAQGLKNQRASLEISKRRLASDLEANAIEITRLKAALDQAIAIREQALVRSPIDGVVTQVNSRQGEMASNLGIAKLVDMKQLRVFATVDEVHLPRLKPGAPVEVTFRGNPVVFRGKIALAPMMVKREKRSEADLGVASVRQIEVEIEADEGVTFPQLLGHEARVTFL